MTYRDHAPTPRARPSATTIALTVAAAIAGWRPRRDSTVYPDEARPERDSDAVTPAVALLRSFALQDWLVVIYLFVFLVAVVFGHGAGRSISIACVSVDLALVSLALLAVRADWIRSELARALLYRAALFGAVFGSFLQFQWLLPTASGPDLDAQIYAIDLKIFGFEPAEAWDRFVTPTTTEWFSFFYYGYFVLLGIHIFPFMLWAKRTKLLEEFSFGILSVFCVGQLFYLVVPGHGPYAYLASHFHHELAGATWWPLVRETVESVDGSARTDIFPSLHTAAPTFLALFSFRHRKLAPFKYSWPVLAFFVSQIIGATMFLRWHYLLDICAGLTLASLAAYAVPRLVAWERNRRERLGTPPVFERVPWRPTRTDAT